MTKFTTAAAAAALAIGIAGVATAADVTLRVQHFISNKGAIPAHFILPWAEKVEKDSGGRIDVEVYPRMQLGGKPPALYDQARDGVVDITWAIPAYTPGRFPGTETLELPFIGSNSAEKTSMAAWEFFEKYLKDEFKDTHILAVHVHGPGIMHFRGEPVDTLAGMSGKKMRTPSRLGGKMLEAAGAVPVGMPVPAFPEALSKGVVDGGVIPWEIVVPLKVHELAESHVVMGGDNPWYNTFFIYAMNKDSYNNLPDDLKTVIDDNSGMMASAWAGRAMEQGDAPSLDIVKGTDNTIITLSDDETAKWKALGDKVTADWIADMTAKGYPAQAMVDDVRAMVAKHNQ
ncbi:MAG: TRAP transporter substrate-binding protein [Pseudomonadota bacterium]